MKRCWYPLISDLKQILWHQTKLVCPSLPEEFFSECNRRVRNDFNLITFNHCLRLMQRTCISFIHWPHVEIAISLTINGSTLKEQNKYKLIKNIDSRYTWLHMPASSTGPYWYRVMKKVLVLMGAASSVAEISASTIITMEIHTCINLPVALVYNLTGVGFGGTYWWGGRLQLGGAAITQKKLLWMVYYL